MKIKKIIVLCACAITAVIGVFATSASVDYSMMSYTEQIKNQIENERQVYTEKMFEKVEVIRPWYSIDPTAWTYCVTLAGEEERLYKYSNGKFVETGP